MNIVKIPSVDLTDTNITSSNVRSLFPLNETIITPAWPLPWLPQMIERSDFLFWIRDRKIPSPPRLAELAAIAIALGTSTVPPSEGNYASAHRRRVRARSAE
jgi:hypothetical protein